MHEPSHSPMTVDEATALRDLSRDLMVEARLRGLRDWHDSYAKRVYSLDRIIIKAKRREGVRV